MFRTPEVQSARWLPPAPRYPDPLTRPITGRVDFTAAKETVRAAIARVPLDAEQRKFIVEVFGMRGMPGAQRVDEILSEMTRGRGTYATAARSLLSEALRISGVHLKAQSLGAGPGPTRRYYVDVGIPGGANIPVDVPLQAIADDLMTTIGPRLDAGVNQATAQIKAAVEEGVAKPIQDGLASGSLIVQNATSSVNWGGIVFSALVGAAVGFAVGRRKR